jgi:archaetidylinositol phosphate synthase
VAHLPRKRRLGRELLVEAFFGPLADRLALVLAPLRVPPPAVVLANGVAGVLAAAALLAGNFLLAALLLQVKTLLDNADGRVARVTGRITLAGRYLDTLVDLAVNVVLFAALGAVTGEPWLALAALVAVTLVLSVNFNLAEVTTEVHGGSKVSPARMGGATERMLERTYAWIFGPQDRFLRAASARRLEDLLRAERDSGVRHTATLAYHDRVNATVLANLGLSTQLAVLGVWLVAGAPEVYLWLVLGSLLLLPPLQLRRERLARRALAGGTPVVPVTPPPAA